MVCVVGDETLPLPMGEYVTRPFHFPWGEYITRLFHLPWGSMCGPDWEQPL